MYWTKRTNKIIDNKRLSSYNDIKITRTPYRYINNQKLHIINGGEKMLNKSMVIDDILYKYPQLEEIFKNHGIKCFG